MEWVALLAAGCGSSGGPEHDNIPDAGSDAPVSRCEGGRPGDVALTLENPTGLLASTTDARGVATAFGSLLASQSLAANRRPARRHGIECTIPAPTPDPYFPYTCDCPGGGTIFVDGTADKTTYNVVFDYRECCLDVCCYDGCGWMATTDNGSFIMCVWHSLTASCPQPALIEYSYCQDSVGGSLWYLVEYLGETFAVSGSYEIGVGGTWTVRDTATEWTCSEDGTGSGSCTDGVDVLSW